VKAKAKYFWKSLRYIEGNTYWIATSIGLTELASVFSLTCKKIMLSN